MRFPTVLAATLLCAAVAHGQQTHGYGFVGPMSAVSNPFTRFEGNLLQAGAGVEGHIGSYFAVNGEGSGVFSTANRYGGQFFVGSVGPSVHPLGRKGGRFDPFFSAGPAIAVGGGSAGLVYFGGGTNVWLSKHIGVRFDIRDHIPFTTDRVHLVAFRFGVAFR